MSLFRQIDALITEAIARSVFPGAVVLVARGDAIRHFAAYGNTMYGATGSRPVARDTIYDIASVTKIFTASAALRLIDEGRLDLYAPAAAYLPELRAADIAVFHLLTHTSGVDIRLSALREAGRAGVLDAVYCTAPSRPPGTAVAYTNVNTLLLGEIVARLHGASLDEALRALVIEPLGLHDTLFRPSPRLLPRIAPTEVDESWRGTLVHGSVHDESAHVLGGVAGHAGLFSTAADLYRFCRMWLDDRPTTNDQRPTTDKETGRQGDRDHATRKRQPTTDHRPPTTDDTQRPMPSTYRLAPSTYRLAPSAQSILRRETILLARANHTRGLNLACGLGWMIDRPTFMGHAPAGTFGHTGFTGPALVVVPEARLVVVVLNNRVYPQRRPPPFEHHAVTAAIVNAALAET